MLKKTLFIFLFFFSLQSIFSQSFKDVPTEELLTILMQNEQSILSEAEKLWTDYSNLLILYEKAQETLGKSDAYTMSLQSKLEILEKQLDVVVIQLQESESQVMKTFELLENSNDEIARLKKNRKWWIIGGVATAILLVGLEEGLRAYFTR